MIRESQERLSESYCTFSEQHVKISAGHMLEVLHGGTVRSGCDIIMVLSKDVEENCPSKECRKGAWCTISIAMCNKHRV